MLHLVTYFLTLLSVDFKIILINLFIILCLQSKSAN